MDQLLRSDGYCILTCPNGSLSRILEYPSRWRSHWGEAHPNFITDQYIIEQFLEYEGAVFSETDSVLDGFDLADSFGGRPVSYLPTSDKLIAVCRRK